MAGTYEDGFNDAVKTAIELVEGLSKAEALSALRAALEDDE